MIDRNKLNRIQGILSAHQGAEIPKFNPGGVVEPNKQYSKHYLEWLKLQQNSPAPTDPEAQKLYQVSFPDKYLYENITDNTETLNGSKPATTVVGAPEVTPITLLENAAQTSKETSRAVIQQQALEAAKKAMAEVPHIKLNNPNPEDEGQGNEDVTGSDDNEDSAGMDDDAGDEENNEKKNNWLKKAGKSVGEFGLNVGIQAFHGVGAALGAQQSATDSTTTKTADAIYDQASEIVKKMGPVGQVVGTAMGFAGQAGDIIQGLGGGTDQMTNTDKWMDSSFFSWNIGMLNGFGGKKSDAFAADQDILARVGSSYGGTTEDINNAASKASKKYGLFSSGARKKANRQIANARAKQNLMGDISDEAIDQRLAVQSMGEQAGLAYSLMTDGGYSQKYTYAAKQGGLLEWNPMIELEWEPQIELNWELPEFKEGGSIDLVEELEWIPEFKGGGKTEESNIPEIEETTQKNVIPEGALHKNKHHMEHAEGLTKKGIPVIDEDGEQQAEIEHSEIIFTLEVTKKLEEYYDIFYSEESSNKEKEQAALDAGKLLVYQILENTEDRTGLIESCKKGGSLKLKNSTDDLIEEVLEWMPTIVVIEEEEVKEEKSKEDKKKSEKEQMKEAIKEVLIELLTK